MESHGPRRYVVQQHELSAFRHWDLMLEQDETLATWQLAVPPEVVAAAETDHSCSGMGTPRPRPGERGASGGGILAKRLPDHRKAYLDYEGTVSGNRGEVHMADAGVYVLLAAHEAEWIVRFDGRILRGLFRIVRQDESSDLWRLTPFVP